VPMDSLLDELSTRLGWARRVVELPAGRYETLMPPTTVADMMIYLGWSMSGRAAQEGRTALSAPGGGTRVGERLTDLPLTLYSDPVAPGLGSTPFVAAPSSSQTLSVFDNGLDITRTDWIRDGSVAALLQNRYSAALTGQQVTPAISNLILDVDDGGGTTEDLLTDVDRGLLLTCLWYIREVDPQTMLLTGLTRDGVYLVEGGEVVGAVNNFRFNESPVDLLGRFEAASATQASFSREWGDYFPFTATPALRIGDFNMSSVSQAQ